MATQPNHQHIRFIKAILGCLEASNTFFVRLYRAPLWISGDDRDVMIDSLKDVMANFKVAASYGFKVLNVPRFKYQPKFHQIAEVRFQLLEDRAKGIKSLSPLTFNCQMDEDFVGRVAQMSRAVSSRAVHRKTLQRYKLAVSSVW